MHREQSYGQLLESVRKLERKNRKLRRQNDRLKAKNTSLLSENDELAEEVRELRAVDSQDWQAFLRFISYLATLVAAVYLAVSFMNGVFGLIEKHMDNAHERAMTELEITREYNFNRAIATPTTLEIEIEITMPETAIAAPIPTPTAEPAPEDEPYINWVLRDWRDPGIDLAAGSSVTPDHLVGYYTSGDMAMFLPGPELSADTHPLIIDGLANVQVMYIEYDGACNSTIRPAKNGDWGYPVRFRDTLNNADASWHQDGIADVVVLSNDYTHCGHGLNMEYRHP